MIEVYKVLFFTEENILNGEDYYLTIQEAQLASGYWRKGREGRYTRLNPTTLTEYEYRQKFIDCKFDNNI